MLEIHRIFDKPTRIAKQILDEVESIDDCKWKEDSYMEHVFLQINLNINLPRVKQFCPTAKSCVQAIPVILDLLQTDSVLFDPPINHVTIFEKLFWDYLSQSDYMRDTLKIPKHLTYKQVCGEARHKSEDCNENSSKIDKL